MLCCYAIFSFHSQTQHQSEDEKARIKSLRNLNPQTECLSDWIVNFLALTLPPGISTEPTNRCNQKLLQVFNFSNWILVPGIVSCFLLTSSSSCHGHTTLVSQAWVRHQVSRSREKDFQPSHDIDGDENNFLLLHFTHSSFCMLLELYHPPAGWNVHNFKLKRCQENDLSL